MTTKIYGTEFKKVIPCGNGAAVLVPKRWMGQIVRCEVENEVDRCWICNGFVKIEKLGGKELWNHLNGKNDHPPFPKCETTKASAMKEYTKWEAEFNKNKVI